MSEHPFTTSAGEDVLLIDARCDTCAFPFTHWEHFCGIEWCRRPIKDAAHAEHPHSCCTHR